MKMLIFQICLFLWNNNAVNAECLPKHGFGLSQSVDPVPVDGDYSFQSDLSECQTRCDTLVVGFFHVISSNNLFNLQEECSYFISEADTCSLYKHAVIEVSTSNETDAGICPKYDPDRPWQDPDTKADKYYPPALSVLGKHAWCGEESICTFPFSLSLVSGSDLYLNLYYIPYNDSSQISKCGTKDNEYIPINYTADELDTAVPCNGE